MEHTARAAHAAIYRLARLAISRRRF